MNSRHFGSELRRHNADKVTFANVVD